jgi:hypothetical protein
MLGAEGAKIIAGAIKVLWLRSAVIGCRSSASVLTSKHIIMQPTMTMHLIIHKRKRPYDAPMNAVQFIAA